MTSDTADESDDRELMRLYDGEREGDLDISADDEQKLASLAAIGSFLRETADADTRADGIADAVMAEIAKDDASEKNERREQRSKSSDERGDVRKLRSAPANDNARSIFAVAMLAAAAAAALFFWGRGQPGDLESARIPAAEAPVAAEMPSRIDPRVAPAPTATAKRERRGVEVASVDFGAQHGSVFYTDGEDAASGATVVWIHEEEKE